MEKSSVLIPDLNKPRVVAVLESLFQVITELHLHNDLPPCPSPPLTTDADSQIVSIRGKFSALRMYTKSNPCYLSTVRRMWHTLNID